MFRGLRRRRDRRAAEQRRSQRESWELHKKQKKKIHVYYETEDANVKWNYYLVEFRLDVPMTANELDELLRKEVGDKI